LGGGADDTPMFLPGHSHSLSSATVGYNRIIGRPQDFTVNKNLAMNGRYGFQQRIRQLIAAKEFGAEARKMNGERIRNHMKQVKGFCAKKRTY